MVALGYALGIGPDILAPSLLLAGDVDTEHPTASGTKASPAYWSSLAEKSERN